MTHVGPNSAVGSQPTAPRPHVGPNAAVGSQPTAPRCLMLAPTLL